MWGNVDDWGMGWKKLPIGFGFRGDKFVVDKIKIDTVIGGCMKCHKEGTFSTTTGKITTIIPKDINKKINKKIKEKK